MLRVLWTCYISGVSEKFSKRLLPRSRFPDVCRFFYQKKKFQLPQYVPYSLPGFLIIVHCFQKKLTTDQLITSISHYEWGHYHIANVIFANWCQIPRLRSLRLWGDRPVARWVKLKHLGDDDNVNGHDDNDGHDDLYIIGRFCLCVCHEKWSLCPPVSNQVL